MVVIINGMLLHENFLQAFAGGIFHTHMVLKLERILNVIQSLSLPTNKNIEA